MQDTFYGYVLCQSVKTMSGHHILALCGVIHFLASINKWYCVCVSKNIFKKTL